MNAFGARFLCNFDQGIEKELLIAFYALLTELFQSRRSIFSVERSCHEGGESASLSFKLF